jgi:hypothetical protein
MDHEHSQVFVLPALIVGPVDIIRLRRELEALDDFLHEASLRPSGGAQSLPKLSRFLDAVANQNSLNLLHANDREALKDVLGRTLKEAPVIHISFSSDPSSAFTAKIIAWFRTNIDPMVLLQIGLQPNIAAGCVVRTANRSYDLSLRKFFDKQKPLLIKWLEGASPSER